MCHWVKTVDVAEKNGFQCLIWRLSHRNTDDGIAQCVEFFLQMSSSGNDRGLQHSRDKSIVRLKRVNCEAGAGEVIECVGHLLHPSLASLLDWRGKKQLHHLAKWTARARNCRESDFEYS